MTDRAGRVSRAGASRAAQRVRQVKDRLYPLTPITKALEFLVECLPRQFVDVRLEADRDVVALTDGEFRATGDAPSFAMRLHPARAQGGWYYLEAALVRHTGDREAWFRGRRRAVDGTAVDFEIPIPSNLRGSVREVIRIPAGVESLFWTPMRAPGYFSQSELLLHRVSALEAWLRRAHRVLLTLWQQRHAGADAKAGLTLGGALRDLQDAYLRTARMQIQRYRGLDYAGFIARLETPGKDRDAARRRIADAAHRPRFSMIVAPPPSVDPARLDAALRALRAQEYGDWEVFIAAAAPDDAVGALWTRHAREDARIRAIPAAETAEAADPIAAAIADATGDFFVLLDCADVLAPHALLFLAEAILANPDAALVYSDQDALDQDGRRSDPQCKPDWNPDLLHACDYLGALCGYERAALLAAGGWRIDVAPSVRNYALALRVTRDLPPRRIVHVPRVLVHRQSGAHAAPEPDAEDAARHAVAELVGPLGATVEPGLVPGTFRVRHPIPDPPPLVSLIVPTRDKLEILQTCIDSVRSKTDYPNYEIRIVDNGSVEPETRAWLHAVVADPRIHVLRDDRPFNYSALNNRAVAQARGEVVVLLNNDVEVIAPDWLREMVGHALRPEIGAVGAKLLYPNGMVQHAGVVLGIGGVAGHVHRYLDGKDPGYLNRAMVTQNLSVVTAACLAVRKTVYQEAGGLDEEHLQVAFNDVDFCIRLLRAGYRNLFTPHALLYHHESLSRGHDDTPHKKAVFEREFAYMKRRWGPFRDPAYNPNLTLEFEDYSLRRT